MFALPPEIRRVRFSAEFPTPREREALHPCRAPDHAFGRYRSSISIGIASSSWHSSNRFSHPSNCLDEEIPLRFLGDQFLPTGGGQSVVLGPLIVFRHLPFSLDQTLPLETIKRGIQRSRFNRQ